MRGINGSSAKIKLYIPIGGDSRITANQDMITDKIDFILNEDFLSSLAGAKQICKTKVESGVSAGHSTCRMKVNKILPSLRTHKRLL